MSSILSVRGGFEALVDDDVFQQIRSMKWRILNRSRRPYVCSGSREKRILLHCFVMNPPDDLMVDHRNGDTLDNRRENLRICTNSQNQANRTDSRGTSRYKGVYFARKSGRWTANICKDYKTRYLGTFDTEEEAARSYNAAARELFGEYARLNEIPEVKLSEISHAPLPKPVGSVSSDHVVVRTAA